MPAVIDRGGAAATSGAGDAAGTGAAGAASPRYRGNQILVLPICERCQQTVSVTIAHHAAHLYTVSPSLYKISMLGRSTDAQLLRLGRREALCTPAPRRPARRRCPAAGTPRCPPLAAASACPSAATTPCDCRPTAPAHQHMRACCLTSVVTSSRHICNEKPLLSCKHQLTGHKPSHAQLRIEQYSGQAHPRDESVTEELDIDRRAGAAGLANSAAWGAAVGAASCEVPFATGACAAGAAEALEGCVAAVPFGAPFGAPATGAAGALSPSTRLRHSGQCVMRSCAGGTALSVVRVHLLDRCQRWRSRCRYKLC